MKSLKGRLSVFFPLSLFLIFHFVVQKYSVGLISFNVVKGRRFFVISCFMLSFVYGQATGAAVDKEFGVKTVYLEGAYDQLDTSWLANNKNKAADSILKQDC